MKAKVWLVTLALSMGGQAGALDLKKFFQDYIGTNLSIENILNPGQLFKELGKSLADAALKSGAGDLLEIVAPSTKGGVMGTLFSYVPQNEFTGAKHYELADASLQDALNNPFKVGVWEKFAGDLNFSLTEEGKEAGRLLSQLGTNDVEKQALSKQGEAVIEEKRAQMAQSAQVKQQEALSWGIARELGKDRSPIELREQVEQSAQELSTSSQNATSTRATVQALNEAFAQYMAQDQVGREQLTARLNGLATQTALSTAQLTAIHQELVYGRARENERRLQEIITSQEMVGNLKEQMELAMRGTGQVIEGATNLGDGLKTALSGGGAP